MEYSHVPDVVTRLEQKEYSVGMQIFISDYTFFIYILSYTESGGRK